MRIQSVEQNTNFKAKKVKNTTQRPHYTPEMLRDIDKETVDFYPNFDETLEQPRVLPSRFPNIFYLFYCK